MQYIFYQRKPYIMLKNKIVDFVSDLIVELSVTAET
jgi:hypothetical protein